ncbi:MAG: lactonase family protein [Myxococcota bacterium]
MWLALAGCTTNPGIDVRDSHSDLPTGSSSTPTDDGSADATGDPTGSDPTSETGGAPTTDTGPAPAPRLFAYVGSEDGWIRVYTVDPATGALSWVSEIDAGDNPSFLAFSADRRHLYAADEAANELVAFAIDPATGALASLGRIPSNGDAPAHLTVDPSGGWVLAANYGGGTVTAAPILADGALGLAVTTRYTGQNAHQIVVEAGGRFAFVPNLGSNTVSQLAFDPATGALTDNAVPTVAVAAGAGPRHLVFHPTAPFAYLIDETDDTLVGLAYDASVGRLTIRQTVSTLASGVDGSASYCAEVAFGASGRFLYGTNRGDDTVVVFDVDPVTGDLSLVGHVPTGGDWPRHFSIDPLRPNGTGGELLLVANQRSDTVVSFRIDPVTGMPSQTVTTAIPAAPSFVGVVDLPQ